MADRRDKSAKRRLAAGLRVVFATVAFALHAAMAQGQQAGRIDLPGCVALYESGEYQAAVDSLKLLLPELPDSDQAEAYKYLAFSYVMLDMISKARDNFTQMLTEYPSAEIDTISVPPNITVVFKQVKTEKELEEQKAKVSEKSSADWQKRRKTVLTTGVVSGVVALAGAGVGALFLNQAHASYALYDGIHDPSRIDEIAKYRNQTQTQYYSCDASFAVAGLALVYSVCSLTYSAVAHPPKNTKVSVRFQGDGVAVCYGF
jgi:hypothetical protein